MKTWRRTAVFLVCCCAGMVMAQSQPPGPAPPKSGQKPQQQRHDVSHGTYGDRGSPQSPPTSTNLPVATKAQVVPANGAKEERDKSATDRWVTIFTGVLALVAVLQWIAMRQQAKYMRGALEESQQARVSSRQALEETRRSNAATERSNEIAERSLLLGGRSWVVTHGHPEWSSEESGWAFDGVSVVNLSDTPALLKQTAVGYLDRKAAKDLSGLLSSEGAWYDLHGEVVVRDRPVNPFGSSYPVISRPKSDATSLINATLYCIVEYTDCFEKTWRTTIAWQEGPEGDWEPIPDYTSLK